MKKTVIILIALAMMLMVFAVGCGEDDTPATDSPDSIPMNLDDDSDDDNEIARGSDSSGVIKFNLEGATLDDINMRDDSDDTQYRRSTIDMDNLVSAKDN